jgi:hypothetical protein
VDLKTLETLGREALEREAARRGVQHPHEKSRRELLRLIVSDLDDARDLVSGVLQMAIHALPLPSTLKRLRSRWSQPARVRPPAREAQRARVATPAQPAAPAAAAPAAASEASGPTTRSFVEEPIRTHSMARLLAAQGHRERALLIYEELVAKNSADTELAREAGALRDHGALGFAVGELPRPVQRSPDTRETPALASGDSIECCAPRPGELQLRWSVSEAGLERARVLLGAPGELAVRWVDIRPDASRVVRSEITEHGPVAARGEWTLPASSGSARAFAAVGLREAQRFVSIAHVRAS